MQKVQVECVYAETDKELAERVNRCCTRLAEYGNEVMNVSYAIRRRQAVLRRRNQTVLLEQLKTKEDEPLKTIACIR